VKLDIQSLKLTTVILLRRPEECGLNGYTLALRRGSAYVLSGEAGHICTMIGDPKERPDSKLSLSLLDPIPYDPSTSAKSP